MASYNYTAHLQHYKKIEHKSLRSLATMRSQNSEGRKHDIVARLMVQDEETGAWPSMNYPCAMQAEDFVPGEMAEETGAAPADSEHWEVVPAKKNPKAKWAEKVEAPGYMEAAPVATDEEALVSDTEGSTIAETEPEDGLVYPVHEMVHDTRAFESADGKNNAIPLQQLAKEWDAYWGASTTTPKITAAATSGSSGSSSYSALTGTTTLADSDNPMPISWPGVLQSSWTWIVEKEADWEHQDTEARQGGQVDETPALEFTELQAEDVTKKNKAGHFTNDGSTSAAVTDSVSTQPSDDVTPKTTEMGHGTKEDALTPSAEVSHGSGSALGAVDSDGGIHEKLLFADAHMEVPEHINEQRDEQTAMAAKKQRKRGKKGARRRRRR